MKDRIQGISIYICIYIYTYMYGESAKPGNGVEGFEVSRVSVLSKLKFEGLLRPPIPESLAP